MTGSRVHSVTAALCAVLIALVAGGAYVAPATARETRQLTVTPVRAAASAVVNMTVLAQMDAARPQVAEAPAPLVAPGPLTPAGPGARSVAGLYTAPRIAGLGPRTAGAKRAPSPGPAQTFAGLDDIRDLSTGYRFIPPDTDGAVGLTKVMSGLNNNYRIFAKNTGAVLSTVGTGAFWSAVAGVLPFDPRTLYDPVNDRWLAVMLADAAAADSSIMVGVSQTSDPSGAWYQFRIDADPTEAAWADFPTVGFNKHFVAINVNMFGTGDFSYRGSQMLILDYPALRRGICAGWTVDGTAYTASPAASYSATDAALYVVTQPWSTQGTYYLDTITKDPVTGRPIYSPGPARSRGLSWSVPYGNVLPQKATPAVPVPMRIESQDDMVRSTPVARDGFIYYTQTVGLPAGATPSRTSILWTRLTAATGGVADGGLIDDPTATATNGGAWYSYPHIAVNKAGDVIVGFSRFSSEQWASAGYAMRAVGDPPGTMRDAVVYKAGEDVYQKDYSSGRNRWGDYSKAQVDPSNDADLWVVNEYARIIPDDSVLDSKVITSPGDWGGVWGTWWARVSPLTVVITPSVGGGLGSVSPATPQTVAAGATPGFTFRPSTGYRIETVTVDGQPVTMTGPNSYTFPPVAANHALVVTFATDHRYAVTAVPQTAGGTVTPLGTTWVPLGGSLTVAVVPDPNHHVDRVTIDGAAVRPATSYTFGYVSSAHRLQASFALDAYTVTPSVVNGLLGHGTVSPGTARTCVWGSTPTFRFTPASGYAVFDVRVDGVQILPTPRASYTFAPLTGPHTISVRFVRGYVPTPQ